MGTWINHQRGYYMSFSTIIEKYRNNSFNKADQGTRFENLCKAFIKTSSLFAGQGVKDIWLWNEFPSRKDFGTGHDVGIDLVVRTVDDAYWAVQCKCYSESTIIDKKDVDTFISSSSRAFNDVSESGHVVKFSRRLWFDTANEPPRPKGRGIGSLTASPSCIDFGLHAKI